MVERIIGELRKIVRYIRLHSETPPVWRQVRMTMMSVLNARHHSSIGCSPFRALFGNNMLEGRGSLEELWTPCIGSEEEEQQQLSSEYVTKLSELLTTIQDKARGRSEETLGSLHEWGEGVIVGQLVWLVRETSRIMGKNVTRNMGPFKVVEVEDDFFCWIESLDKRR
ncbi:hypothetical protein ADUPG1_000808, partial [Aduncisulcus paluster]